MTTALIKSATIAVCRFMLTFFSWFKNSLDSFLVDILFVLSKTYGRMETRFSKENIKEFLFSFQKNHPHIVEDKNLNREFKHEGDLDEGNMELEKVQETDL